MKAHKKLCHTLRCLVRRYFNYRLYQKLVPAVTDELPNLDSYGFLQAKNQIQTGNHSKIKEF